MTVGLQPRVRVSSPDFALSVEVEVSMHHVRSGGLMRKRWSRGKSRKAIELITVEEEKIELRGVRGVW